MDRKIKPTKSLFFKVVASTVFITVLMQGGFAYFSLKAQARFVDLTFKEIHTSSVSAFNAGISLSDARDVRLLRNRLQSFIFQAPSVLNAKIYLFDEDGSYDVVASNVDSDAVDREKEISSILRDEESVLISTDEELTLIAPLQASGVLYGVMEVDFNHSVRERLLSEQSGYLLYVFLAEVIVIIILILLFFKFAVSDRINSMLAGISSISRGDFGEKVPEGSDEIGQLGASINDMAKDLKKYYSALESKAKTSSRELSGAEVEMEKQQSALLNLLEDLNEEKKIKETQSENLLENMGEGIIMTKDDGEITYVNPALQNLLGFQPSDLVGKLISNALEAYDINGDKISPTNLSDTAMITAENQETKLDFVSKDKERVSVVVNASPINVEGEFKGVIRIIHDISAEVKLAQQKDDFFSIASHELRTPLTVISGNLDIVLQGYGKSKLTKDDEALLKDTIEASDRLIKMVNDFLNVSRLDQGRLKYDPEKLELNTVVRATVKDLQPLAKDKNLYLKLRRPKSTIKIEGDRGLIREIVTNLIGNALKFTKEGGITLEEKIVNSMVEIRVIDTGAGIKKDLQETLFKRFQQATANKTLAREAGGTGLGLYISREFARKMGGDLVLEKSILGKGSTFLVTLPLLDSSKKSS